MATQSSEDDIVSSSEPIVVSDEDFLQNKPLVLEALTNYDREIHARDRDFYRCLYPRYKTDPDIALAALTHICGQIVYLPKTPEFALWKDIPKELRNDPAFCAKACSVLGEDEISLDNINVTAPAFLENLTKLPSYLFPTMLEQNPSVVNERLLWLAVTRSDSLDPKKCFNEHAPLAMYSDYEIMAEAVSRGHLWDLVDDALFDERRFWLALIRAADENGDDEVYELDVESYFEEHAPPVMLHDRDVMVEGCSRNYLWKFADDALLNDPGFLKDVLKLEPTILADFDAQALTRFPDLLVEFLPIALRKVHNSDYKNDDTLTEPSEWMSHMADTIPQELWNRNRHVVRAWFKGGGTFLEEKHGEYLNNPLVACWICQFHLPETDGTGRVKIFKQAAPALLSDKDFMIRAVALNADLFHVATKVLQHDFSFQLAAFGGTAGRFPRVDCLTWSTLLQHMRQFRIRASEELQSHRDFEMLAQQVPSLLPFPLIVTSKVLPDETRVKKLQVAVENIAAATLLQSRMEHL